MTFCSMFYHMSLTTEDTQALVANSICKTI